MSEQMNLQITAQNHASRAIKDVSRDLGGLRGASQSAGLKLKAAFVGAGLAIAATVRFIESATKAAMEEENINKRLIGVLKSRKMATEASTDAIAKQVEAGKKLAFSSDEIKSSLAGIIPFAKDTTEAINIQKAAMEVAAAQHISLSKASTIVSRAFIGQGKSLAKLGIQTTNTHTVTQRVLVANQKWGASYKNVTKQVKEVAKGQTVLDMIMKKYGGTAANAAESVENQFKIFTNTVSDLKQEFGRAFLPIALKIAQTLNKDILPQLKPVITGVADFITKNIPKFLADVDPIIQKIAGPNGLLAGFMAMASAVWGTNGEGPLGKAVAGLGQLLETVLTTAQQIIATITGTPMPSTFTDTFHQFGSRNPAFAPTQDRMQNGGINLGGIPLIGGLLKGAGANVNQMGVAGAATAVGGGALVSKLLFRKIPGLSMLASLGLGGYMMGNSGSNSTPMEALSAFAGGAGTLQALSFFGGMRGGGGGSATPHMGAAPSKPGMFGKFKNALIPSFLRSNTAPGAAAMGGAGAVTMSAGTVYINAQSVSGMGGGLPGMGALQGPPVPEGLTTGGKGIFGRISAKLGGWKSAVTGTSEFGKLKSAASFGAEMFGLQNAGAGFKMVGNGIKGVGSKALGGVASVGTKIAESGVGKVVTSGASLLGRGAGGVAKGLGTAGKFASKGISALGAGMPIIGGVLAGASALAEGNGIGQAIGKGVGNAAGTAIGAGLLSWIPVAGPLLGGMIGGAIGESIGGAIGEAVDGIGQNGTAAVSAQSKAKYGEAGSYQYAIGQMYSSTALNGGQAPQITINLNDKPINDSIEKVIAKLPGRGGSRTLQ
jgi:hypothetical protein